MIDKLLKRGSKRVHCMHVDAMATFKMRSEWPVPNKDSSSRGVEKAANFPEENAEGKAVDVVDVRSASSYPVGLIYHNANLSIALD